MAVEIIHRGRGHRRHTLEDTGKHTQVACVQTDGEPAVVRKRSIHGRKGILPTWKLSWGCWCCPTTTPSLIAPRHLTLSSAKRSAVLTSRRTPRMPPLPPPLVAVGGASLGSSSSTRSYFLPPLEKQSIDRCPWTPHCRVNAPAGLSTKTQATARAKSRTAGEKTKRSGARRERGEQHRIKEGSKETS